MKKTLPRRITNPERIVPRRLQLAQEKVRVLRPEALALALSGCDSTTWTSKQPDGSQQAC
ncbi:MAG TPA: hypothetical protein VHW23_15575 [Kofleriaceae bacterium]|jgi:hypothetical protein|nr:hypothetical protein [Kofleriaceae bacterium]